MMSEGDGVRSEGGLAAFDANAIPLGDIVSRFGTGEPLETENVQTPAITGMAAARAAVADALAVIDQNPLLD